MKFTSRILEGSNPRRGSVERRRGIGFRGSRGLQRDATGGRASGFGEDGAPKTLRGLGQPAGRIRTEGFTIRAIRETESI